MATGGDRVADRELVQVLQRAVDRGHVAGHDLRPVDRGGRLPVVLRDDRAQLRVAHDAGELIDHVGIGLDWDGGGGVTGLEDIADLPKITKALLAAGYTEADVAKVWSGNVLRVLAAAEAEAARETS